MVVWRWFGREPKARRFDCFGYPNAIWYPHCFAASFCCVFGSLFDAVNVVFAVVSISAVAVSLTVAVCVAFAFAFVYCG